MADRWGLGPVFTYESLLNARRWQVYAGRSLFVLILLIGMGCVWASATTWAPGPGVALTFQQMAAIGEGFFYALTGIQVALILLAAPAAAGSICVDRSRGTLLHVMVTDLSDVEIVLGKLGSRLAPVLGLLACGVPVTALAALLGGIDFGALLGAFVVTMALAVLGCTMAMVLSIWAKKTHEVLLAVYMVFGLGLIALPTWWGMTHGMKLRTPPDWFQKANPFVIVFAPYNKPGFVHAIDYAVFVGVALAISAALAVVTIWRLRRSVVSSSGRAERANRRGFELSKIFPSLPGPSLDRNPVLWREWHRNRPSRFARLIWLGLMLLTWSLAAWGTADLISGGDQNRPNALTTAFLIQLVFGLLILSATAPTALAEERVRGSLDVLMATPIPSRSIVEAKWWGAYRMVLMLMPLPFLTTTFLVALSPDIPTWATTNRVFSQTPVPLTVLERVVAVVLEPADFLASGAVIVSLGVALATWVRRLGRAVAASVIAFVVLGIGWPILVETVLFRIVRSFSNSFDWQARNRWLLHCLVAPSPIVGPLSSLQVLQGSPFEDRWWSWVGLTVVVALKAAVAAGLFWLTCRTFDRCLGRVREVRPTGVDARTEAPEALTASLG